MGERAKSLGVGGLIGLVIGLGVIYWLRPLNAGAIGLVLLLTMGFSAVLVGGVRRRLGGSKEETNEKSGSKGETNEKSGSKGETNEKK